ncbi:MAG: polysaccharide export outer membrane protein [Cyclobacteriaceae bacterium]|jgi:polysaccharide export outer membrane protein
MLRKIIPLILVCFLVSCIPNKQIVYLQDGEIVANEDLLYAITYNEYVLQKGDILNIEITSVDPSIAEIFKSSTTGNAAGQLAQNGADLNYLTGFLINENGDIDLPLIGNLQLAGFTLQKSKIEIAREVKKYINEPYIVVRLGGIRFSALGEFNNPGRYSILQSKVTIFEAIADAGDLSILANRKELLLIRKNENGLSTHRIDLTQRELLSSPFYYIQPNDMLYVEPLPVRQLGGGVGVTGFETFTTALSIISSALVLIISINNLNGQ